MAYYRRDWEAGLEALESWWQISTEYVRLNGENFLPTDYRRLSEEVLAFARNVAKIDASRLQELALMVDNHAKAPPAISRLPITVSIDQLWLAAEMAVTTKDQLFAAGIVRNRPRTTGRPKSPERIKAEKMIKDGHDNDAVQKRTGLSVGFVRKIRSELPQKRY